MPTPETYQAVPDGHIVSFLQREDVASFIAPPSSAADWIDWANHSAALFVTERTDLALIAAREALRLKRTPATLLNLAVVLETMSEFYTAFPLIEEAYKINPAHSFIRTLYSDDLLRMGRFPEAWPVYYSSHTNWDWVRNIWPEWDGRSSLAGKRLLVLSGGGFGDNIAFLRWLPRLKSLGAFVTYMCPKSFAPMLSQFSAIDRFIAGSASGLEGNFEVPVSDYDCYTCVLSLGEYFCPMPGDIPAAPYLHADPHHAWVHRGLLPLIGLCSHAGEEKFPRRHRSLRREQMMKIISTLPLSRAEWVNLNYDSPLPCAYPVVLNDWRETASVIANLDLVVTVDTGVAHLAGALNVPCWVILPGLSAHYYGVSGDRSIWYASQRLFRNGGEGIDHSIELVCDALQKEFL